MLQKFQVHKKKAGILILLIFVLIIVGILYSKYGFKELKKNDTESIFVEENQNNHMQIEESNYDTKNNISTNNKENNISMKDKSIVVEIKGEVKKPDVYTLDENAIIKELIEAAGGLTENADLRNINRAKKIQNHELVYIANKNDKSSSNVSELDQNKNTGISNNIVNINSASLEELKTINGIGDSKAKSIIEYREKNGGFKSIEDIKNVTGIGEKMFDIMKEQIEI